MSSLLDREQGHVGLARDLNVGEQEVRHCAVILLLRVVHINYALMRRKALYNYHLELVVQQFFIGRASFYLFPHFAY
jgi:hypothetical protein